MTSDVFISYSKEDRRVATLVCDELEKRGLSCWIAPRNIRSGELWPEAIVRNAMRCRTTGLAAHNGRPSGGLCAWLAVLSSHSANSRQIARELETADSAGARMLAFRVEDVHPRLRLPFTSVTCSGWMRSAADWKRQSSNSLRRCGRPERERA